jgi:Flp pilus assembly protein TadD
MRRGAWRDALASFDRALDAKHPDSAGLRLLKVRAWCALHEIPRAARELEDLSRRDDLGKLEGQVLLWQADIALNRSLDDPKALKLVDRALLKGLPPAEKAYAQGLLAKTSPQAVRHFRRAVERDPFHPRANGMLVLLLLTLGQLTEARERVTVAGLLFPEDPTFPMLRGQISALEGDLPGAYATLDRARTQLGKRQRAAARALAELLHLARGVAPLLTDPDASFALKLVQLAPAGARVWAAVRTLEGGKKGDSPLLLPIPPVLLDVGRSLSTTLPLVVMPGKPDQAITALSEAVRTHPEGLLYLTLGVKLVDADRWREARQAFLEATKTSSLLPVRNAALFAAACAEWVLADLRGRAPNKKMMAQALRHARELVARGGMERSHADLLSRLAMDGGDFNLGRWIVADWERQARGDLRPLRRALAVEIQAEAYGPALQLARRILDKNPLDAEALRQRSVAEAGLRKQAKAIAAGGKVKPD